MNQYGGRYETSIRLLLKGDYNVGKSSILMRLWKDTFSEIYSSEL